MVVLGPYNTSSEMHHSFGSLHFPLINGYILTHGQIINPAIGKAEMVKPDTSQVN